MCFNIKFNQLLSILCFCTLTISVIAQETQEEGKKIQLKKIQSTNEGTTQAELKMPGVGTGTVLQYTVIEDDIMKTGGEGGNAEEGGGTFSGVGDGKIEEIKSIMTGDKNLLERLSKSVQIYPVPARDFVNVATQENQIAEIRLTNSLGQTIYTENEPNSIIQLNISELSQGVYYILITTKDQVSVVKSIVKQ